MDLVDDLPRASTLPHPLMPGASPLVDDLDTVRRLEDAGAAAIVMHSLFEEQIAREQLGDLRAHRAHGESLRRGALATSRAATTSRSGPTSTSSSSAASRRRSRVPVIASLNGTTPGGWLEYARLIEQAGADALELNVYSLADRPDESGRRRRARTRRRSCASVQARDPRSRSRSSSRRSTRRSPHFARRLDGAGADGLVLFNRFYQPDIDLEELDVVRDAAPLRLRPSCCCACAGWRSSRAACARSLAVDRRRAHGRRRGQGGHGRRPRACSWSRRCCAHGPEHLRRCCDEHDATGWRSTSTSRSRRCAAA